MSEKLVWPQKFDKRQRKQRKIRGLNKRLQKATARKIELNLRIIQGHPKLREYYIQELTKISEAGNRRKKMMLIMAIEATEQYAKGQKIPWRL